MVLYLEIAGVVFRIESDVSIKGLKSSKLKSFQTGSTNSDVSHFYKVINDDSLALHPLTRTEEDSINKFTCFPKNNHFSNPLFKSHLIWKYLDLKETDLIALEIQQDAITIFNHKNCEIRFFYSQSFRKDLSNFMLGPSLFTQFLANFSAVMIHSSAVIIENKTAVFLAPDEGGKTTALKLAPGYPVLSDDQNIIRKENDEFIVHNTPWSSFKNEPFKAPLGAFFLLKKGKNFKLEKLKSKEIFTYLWGEHLPYYYNLPKIIKKKYFDFLHEISFKIPGYQILFPKDYVDWNAIEQAMKG